MYFLVDNDRKVLFGWSAKCGCSHIKNIFHFLQTNNLDNTLNTKEEYCSLPNDIENYTTIIVCRNPYERIVSGFLDKYRKNGEFRFLWKYPVINFSKFVDEVTKDNREVIEKHHFVPQTKEEFDKKILLSKSIKLYDISNIDYKYIENLYNKKIPDYVIKKKYGHEREFQIKKKVCINKYVYDLDLDSYADNKVDIKYFYNKEIKNKIFNYFIEDFNFFYENNINYMSFLENTNSEN